MQAMKRQRLGRPAGLPSDKLASYELRRGQPLPLFEALAHSPTAFEDLAAGTHAAINRTVLPMREREVLILRTLAQWGARAEWDVHVLIYAPVAPITLAEVEWLGGGGHATTWTARERLLIDVADHLRRDAALPRNLWDGIAHLFSSAECAEILMIAGQYVKVALITNALAIPPLAPDGPPISLGGRS